MDVDVLIVGGGVSGLSAAWWLAQRGVAAELWERAPTLGGVVGTRRVGGYAMESGASLMLNFRPEVTAFIEQSGLAPEKLALRSDAPRFVVQRGMLAQVPTRLGSQAFTPFWSGCGRLRLLAEPLIPRGGDEAETASAFVTRRLGCEALEKVFEPMLASTFGCDPDLAQARAVLPRLTALEQRFGSIAVGVLVRKLRRQAAPAMEMFSFKGGMQSLIDALARNPGVSVRTECTAAVLVREPDGWAALACAREGERRLRARHVVLSVPAMEAAELLDPNDPELAALIGGLEYAPLAVVHLGFERAAIEHRLDGMGFLVPRAEARALLGCQWSAGVLAERAPGGRVLLSAFLGGARAPQIAQWDEAAIAGAALDQLTALLGLRDAPETTQVVRHTRGLPLYHGNHLRRVRDVRERLRRWPGLHIAANYLDGVSTRDRIVSGYAVAGEICSQLLAASGGAAARARARAPRAAPT